MASLTPGTKRSPINQVLYCKSGWHEGQHLLLDYLESNHISVYESPSIKSRKHLDGNVSDSVHELNHNQDIYGFLMDSDSDFLSQVDFDACRKWRFFFGLEQLSTLHLINQRGPSVEDVIQPLRKDHFHSIMQLLRLRDDVLKEMFLPLGKFLPQSGDRENSDPSEELIRLYLVGHGFTFFVSESYQTFRWFSDDSEGTHTKSPSKLWRETDTNNLQRLQSSLDFSDHWRAPTYFNLTELRRSFLDSRLVSENYINEWFESSPIHRMRLGLNYFQSRKVAGKSLKILYEILMSEPRLMNNKYYEVGIAPWHGRLLRGK